MQGMKMSVKLAATFMLLTREPDVLQ